MVNLSIAVHAKSLGTMGKCKMPFRINWSIFEGSSHCEDGIAELADGNITNFTAWYKWHYPWMPIPARYVRTVKKYLTFNEVRRRAKRKSRKEGWR